MTDLLWLRELRDKASQEQSSPEHFEAKEALRDLGFDEYTGESPLTECALALEKQQKLNDHADGCDDCQYEGINPVTDCGEANRLQGEAFHLRVSSLAALAAAHAGAAEEGKCEA